MLPDSPVGIEDDSMSACAPANEIEITPEMIEAGCLAISHYRYDKSNEEEIVATIFAAMAEVRCR